AKTYRDLYVISIMTLSIICCALFLIPEFSKESYRIFRIFLFGSLALFGVIPIVHLFWMHGFNNDKLTGIMMAMNTYLLYGLATFFYAVRLPERFFPKRFDIWVCFCQKDLLIYSFIHINGGMYLC